MPNDSNTMIDALTFMARAIEPLPSAERNSVRVTLLLWADAVRRRRAISNQLMMNPLIQAGTNQKAHIPFANANPLRPSMVHADDADAEELNAATQGPSPRPPK